MRWKAGGQRDTGHDCLLVEENRFGAVFEGFTLVRGVYCEVKASVLATCGTPNLHGMQGEYLVFISVLRRVELSHWVSRH